MQLQRKHRNRQRGRFREIPNCRDSGTVCNDNFGDYPTRSIRRLIKRHPTWSNRKVFDQVFGPSCEVPETEVSLDTDIQLKNGFDFNLREEALCRSNQRYIFPTKAKNVDGDWRYVVNVPNFRQGVTVVECARNTEGNTNISTNRT